MLWLAVLLAAPVLAQDIEPRRWTPLPTGTKVLGVGFAHTTGDLFFDPVLEIENARVDLDTVAMSFVQSFSAFGKPVRVDGLLPWQTARWDGLLAGEPASTERSGLADPRVRLSVNLIGAPVLDAGEFRDYMSSRRAHTVVGAAIAVSVPWGEYFDDRLLNLGQNRFIIRPQVGVLHIRGPWSYELTGSVFIYTDNDDFFGGNKREQDPLYALQTHFVRTFKPGYWASLSAGYGWGGRSTINSVSKNDERGDFLSALSIGVPVGKQQGLKFAYIRGRANNDAGADTDSLALAWSLRF